MNLPVPVVGTDPGPDWANNINACLGIIDSHNHIPGEGVPITPDGIDINASLPMNNFDLITARSVRFTSQVAPISGGSDLGCIYESGVDLYYNDGSGNHIRITQSGSVTGATGTITGLPSGTASASYSTGTFTFQSATSTPAALAVGPTTIAQQVANGKGVTFSANASQANNYNLALPIALPTIQSTPVSDVSGNLTFLALAASTFSPTVTNTNFSGPSLTIVQNTSNWYYTRIGTIVHVQGIVNYTISGYTSGSSSYRWQATIPIPTTTLTNAGTTFDSSGVSSGSVIVNIGNTQAQMAVPSIYSANQTSNITFDYMYGIN